MKSSEHLLSLLATIPDPRRAEGKLYQLRHVLLFSIFAIVSGANSYRGLQTYFRVHREKLNEAFAHQLEKAARAHGHPLCLAAAQRRGGRKVFREHAANLNCAPEGANARVIAFDGKTLKGSFDNFNGCSPSGRCAPDKGVNLFRFSALWEFLLGGYAGRGEGQRGGDGDAGGFEQVAHVVARRRDLIVGGPAADDHFDDAEAGEPVEALLHGQVDVAPAPAQGVHQEIGQHDDEGVAAGAVLVAQIDRPHLELHGLASRNAHSTWARSLYRSCTILCDDGLRQIGAQRVAAVEARRLGQGRLVHRDERRAAPPSATATNLSRPSVFGLGLQPGHLRLRRRSRMLVQIRVGRFGGGSQRRELVGREAASSSARAGLRRRT